MKPAVRARGLVCSVLFIILLSLSETNLLANSSVSSAPSSLSFGSVSVNGFSSPQSFTITNAGSQKLTITSVVSISPFAVSGPTLPLQLRTGQSASFQVVFQPTSSGTFSGNIAVQFNRANQGTSMIPVSGTGIATATLSPSSNALSLGSVPIGSTTSQSVTLTNSGNASVTISQLGTSGAGFAAKGLSSPLTLPAGQSAPVTVNFSPTSAGSVTGAVSVLSNAANSPMTIALTGTGVQPTAVPLSITSGSLANGQQGTVYSAALVASGGTAPYSWSISAGSLPAGLTLSSSGQISGTPTTAGTSSFTVKVTDSSSPVQNATANLSITVAAGVTPVQITTSSLPSGQTNSAYSATLSASGGTAPYSWSISSGSLPAGLTLSSSGQISGTPTTAGTSSFTIRATDSSSPAENDTANLSINLINLSSGGGSATVILCPNNGQTGNSANCVQPPVLTFGKQGTGTTSAALAVSVNNCSTPNIAACTGSGSVTLGNPYFSISGANAGDFSGTASGSCSNGLLLSSGLSCTIVLRFTPSQPAGTAETATLTVNSTGNPQTISLTGTSATVTNISSCQSLSGNTNYQLTANVTAPGSCFTVGGSDTDLNLDGFTVTYCTSSSSSLVGGVLMNGSLTSNTTVHNGAINEGSGNCTGLGPSGVVGPGAVIASSEGQSSASTGTTVFNVTSTIKAKQAKVLFEEDAGAATSAGTVMHDVIYTDNDTYSCGNVGCRDSDQGYPIIVDQSANAGPSRFYNITGTGGTQGAIMSTAAHSIFNNNFISPGSNTVTNSNGFIFQDWGTGATIHDNLTTGSGGSCVSCRGIQVSSANNTPVSGTVVQNNVLRVTNLPNSVEYSGCQLQGAYGIQINTAGSGIDLSNNTFQNNRVTVIADACPGFGFSWSSATTGQGPNHTINNTFTCQYSPGHTGNGVCAGIQLVGNQYSPNPDNAVVSTGDIFTGDTSDIYIFYNGTPAWTCTRCTFGKGTNASSDWVMLDYDNGFQSGGSSNPMHLVDPTFTGGATKDSNNLAMWASNNPSLSFNYTIQWTYTVTVTGASSGNPINGATVTATDSQGKQECSGSTNASGVFSCVLNDTRYGAASGQYTITNFNPFSVTISGSGCGNLNYNKTILSTTSETVIIPGC